MDRIGAAVVLLIVLAIGGGFALHRHNADGRARQMDAIAVQLLAEDAAKREAIRTDPQRVAEVAACARSLPAAKCRRLYLALDCYEGRYECADACAQGGTDYARWPDYKGS